MNGTPHMVYSWEMTPRDTEIDGKMKKKWWIVQPSDQLAAGWW